MKRNRIAISVALASVLAATPVMFAGCSGDGNYTEIKFAAQDTSYVVTSQGGSVVSYGNYVYFINGSRGYDDTNGKANVWNEVVKGGLYRAEFNGNKTTDDNGLTVFEPVLDDECLEFKYTKGNDYFDNEINVVGSTKIAPKTVGTSGYSGGGVFIYDGYAYFASPNNEKNKSGTVQTTRTDFFMMPLKGGKPTKVYTTSEKIDTSSSPYAFYKFNGNVYLTVKEDSTIVSVKIDPGKAEADDPVFFKVGATSVYFPVRDTYYKGISNNTPEDFIYFVRNVKDGESQKSGTVIEAMRPDGSEKFILSMTGATEEIKAVRNGVLFYTTTEAGEKYLAYNNLHNQLYEYSPRYRSEQDSIDEGERNRHISGKFPTVITSTITDTYPFRADENSNEMFFVAVTSSSLVLYRNDKSEPVVGKLGDIKGTPKFIKNNYLYFAGSSSDFYRTPLFTHMEGFGTEQKIAESTSTATFDCDYAAGYFTYFAQVDQWASGYTFFKKVDGVEGMEPQFVGTRAKSDIPTEKQIEEAKENKTE